MKSKQSEWFNGTCEACQEDHSVRLVEDDGFEPEFMCWECRGPVEFMLIHIEAIKPRELVNA